MEKVAEEVWKRNTKGHDEKKVGKNFSSSIGGFNSRGHQTLGGKEGWAKIREEENIRKEDHREKRKHSTGSTEVTEGKGNIKVKKALNRDFGRTRKR